MKKTSLKFKTAVYGLLAFTLAASYTLSSGVSEKINADETVLSGDVNNDGALTSADASAMVNYLTGKDVKISTANADMNGDKIINIIDGILLINKILNPEQNTEPAVPENPEQNEEKTIILNGDTINVSGGGAVAEGSIVTISEPGTYAVSGKLDDGQIVVDVDKTKYPEGKVELSLEGAQITSLSDSPVYIAGVADECVITVKKGTENVISDGKEYTNADGGSGAVYSKDDLKIKGKGNLTVNGNCTDGIVSKDSVKIFNGNITVNAEDDGIRGKDSVKIGDSDDTDFSNLAVIVNTVSGDGIISSNDTDEEKGKVIINGGTVKIKSFGDGIQAESDVKINGGDIDIYTYQGAAYGTGSAGSMDGNPNKMPSDLSAKAIKSSGTINIAGGNIVADSSDDAVHGAGNVNITGGRLQLSSADDGVHSDEDLTIGNGPSDCFDDVMIYIPKCYEGIEGKNITQNSGTVLVYSADDGFNAAGGSDGSGIAGPGGWGQGGWGGGLSGGGDYSLNLNGGLAYVSAADGDHDGFDSNGSLSVDGAIAISNGNEAFDSDGSKSFNSGTFIELKGSSSGGFGGRPGGFGGMGGSSGFTASFTASVNAQKGSRITVTDQDGKVIVSFVAGKPATSVSVGSKTAASGTVTVSEDIPDGTALPVVGDSQQIYAAP